jgi:hypothetical protein
MTTTFRPGYITDVDIEIPQGGEFLMPHGVIGLQKAITGPAVARNTAYTLGRMVTPLVANDYAYECSTAGTSHASNEPTWPTVVGATVTDGSVVWRCEGGTSDREYLIDTTGFTAFMEIRAENFDGDTVLEATTANGRIVVGFTPVKWVANTIYADGQQVVPTLLNGFIYEVVVAGTSHAATQPTWPTTLGNIVTDGTVTWRAEHVETVANGMVSNCYLQLSTAVTEALTDWGRGLWTMQLIDTFGKTIYFVDGVARLRRETTY